MAYSESQFQIAQIAALVTQNKGEEFDPKLAVERARQLLESARDKPLKKAPELFMGGKAYWDEQTGLIPDLPIFPFDVWLRLIAGETKRSIRERWFKEFLNDSVPFAWVPPDAGLGEGDAQTIMELSAEEVHGKLMKQGFTLTAHYVFFLRFHRWLEKKHPKRKRKSP